MSFLTICNFSHTLVKKYVLLLSAMLYFLYFFHNWRVTFYVNNYWTKCTIL